MLRTAFFLMILVTASSAKLVYVNISRYTLALEDHYVLIGYNESAAKVSVPQISKEDAARWSGQSFLIETKTQFPHEVVFTNCPHALDWLIEEYAGGDKLGFDTIRFKNTDSLVEFIVFNDGRVQIIRTRAVHICNHSGLCIVVDTGKSFRILFIVTSILLFGSLALMILVLKPKKNKKN